MTVREFLNISDIIVPESMERMSEVKRPYILCGQKTPDTINDISFGAFIQLQEIKDVKDMLFVPPIILMGLNEKQVMFEDFERVIGFSNWVAKEVKRICKLFSKTNVTPTREEKQAGIEQMSFGIFGMIDYYAQRMGISDHEEVEKVPWVRIYKCLDMDAQRIRFNRRLRKVFEKEEK